MKVILLKDVSKVGQQGTVKEVADGFAENMLIARGLAVQATPEKIAAYEKNRKIEEAELAKKMEVLAKSIQGLEGKKVEIVARATEKGGLFKALAAKDIAHAFEGQGSKIPLENIQLEKPLKTVGEHKVLVVSGKVQAHITVAVKAA